METLKIFPFLIGICILFSCNNKKSQQNAANQKTDSLKRDIIFQKEQETYGKTLNEQIDSLDFVLTHYDLIYEPQISKAKKWHQSRSRINERMARLKHKRDELKAISKTDWIKFKNEVDTTLTNLKKDWKHVLNDMNAK